MENFLPVRVHVREDADEFKALGQKYGVGWTPGVLFLDAEGKEAYRIEGFLPLVDFLANLELGLGHIAFQHGDFEDAAHRFDAVLTEHAGSKDAAAEALYWAGVSRYKATHDVEVLKETARQFGRRFADTAWARKASVWAG